MELIQPWVWQVLAALARNRHIPECKAALDLAPKEVREHAQSFGSINPPVRRNGF